jgi:hypothetical protein
VLVQRVADNLTVSDFTWQFRLRVLDFELSLLVEETANQPRPVKISGVSLPKGAQEPQDIVAVPMREKETTV